ncbi:hypothetical protein OG21DRAFT_1135523 [Imleria badia]|nr:hypothetical protein OG21DRAFT_1135523 [Imleria badia]
MPQPGTYFIVNTAAPNLAVTFNGTGNPLINEQFDRRIIQQWVVVGPPGGMQSIAPFINESLQTSPQGNFVAPDSSPPEFQWNLVGPGPVSTITYVQGPEPQMWTIYGPARGAPVVLAGVGQGQQNWQFIDVTA